MKTTFTSLAVFLGLFLAGAITSTAQNLVPNPGFETQSGCPQVSQIELASPWNSPTLGTPDLFNTTCSSQQGTPHAGIGSAGIFCLTTSPGWTDNREYLQAPLTSSLEGGTKYYVSFWVLPSSFIRDGINRMGAYLSNSVVNQNTTSVLNFTPQVQNPTDNMLSSSNWVQISGSFTAAGGEAYILIGNFSPDSETDSVVLHSSSNYYSAYYNIDDVYVGTAPTGLAHITELENHINVYPLPASDNVTIETPSLLTINSIKVVNMVGQEIGTIAMDDNISGKIYLNVQSYPTGVYFLSIQTTDGVLTKKIIVAK